TGVATRGNFSIGLTPAQLDATTLKVTATDAAGHRSPGATYVVTASPVDLPDVTVIKGNSDNVDTVTGNVKDQSLIHN
ncbi:Ig-like domain-containing protein, partial [Enterobacter mori]